MRILLIEDDLNKCEQIARFVGADFPDADLIIRRSFQSGLKEAILCTPDLILLDMTMPSYEIGPREPGGRERRYAGREILRQLSRRGIKLPVIVITQYEQFEDDGDIVRLPELVAELRSEYSDNFIDAVFYQAGNTTWMGQLRAMLTGLGGPHDDD
jgi:CheY-like chemotaxis protein